MSASQVTGLEQREVLHGVVPLQLVVQEMLHRRVLGPTTSVHVHKVVPPAPIATSRAGTLQGLSRMSEQPGKVFAPDLRGHIKSFDFNVARHLIMPVSVHVQVAMRLPVQRAHCRVNVETVAIFNVAHRELLVLALVDIVGHLALLVVRCTLPGGVEKTISERVLPEMCC